MPLVGSFPPLRHISRRRARAAAPPLGVMGFI